MDHQLAINTIRFLSVDMVEAAQSGHPGAPLGQASMAYTLWSRHLRFDPVDPAWPNRDRFVLSCGHASALIYALLHLSGYDLPIEELKNFRQLDSRTPGHPEYGHTPGVETTTGPLGQGLSTAVGMAMGEEMLAARFNRPDFPLFDYRTWVIASDGDLMEGVTSEASSFAGHLQLGKLNVLYDDNNISIDGSTDLAFTEDVAARYDAYGWHVSRVDDGNDLEALDAAMTEAASEIERPSLVVVKTHIGYGSPNKQDTAAAHGAPLGADEVALTREALGWPQDGTFLVPEGSRDGLRSAAERGAHERTAWAELMQSYRRAHTGEAAELERRLAGELAPDFDAAVPDFEVADGPMATRKASGAVLNGLVGRAPELVGGSADLTGSNKTFQDGKPVFSAGERDAPNLYFGVREHAMGAVLNGLALTPGFIPYGGTFLIFADYLRPAIRIAALSGLHAIYVFTHDSIFLGEDGPTHQPISHLLGLRAIPNLLVLRPADAVETAEAWKIAVRHRGGPVALSLTRQGLPILEQTLERAADGVARGGYTLVDGEGAPELVLIATGSEVHLAVEAAQQFNADGVSTRAVSLPSWELFDSQDDDYRQSVVPDGVKKLAVEAGTPLGWERYVGEGGDVIGIDGFGASAPGKDLAPRYGFTVDNVLARARRLIDA